MAFDLTNHPLLSSASKGLDAPTLAAHTRLAELLLGIDTSKTYSSEASDQLLLALAMQVNLQSSMPETIFAIASESLGPISTTFINDPKMIDPRAKAIVSRVAATSTTISYTPDSWGTVRSRRSA